MAPRYSSFAECNSWDKACAAEEVLEVNRRLIEAQEQERARIGRELHDDVNQRLAMLAIELEQLQDDPSDVRSRVQELRKQTTEISNDVPAWRSVTSMLTPIMRTGSRDSFIRTCQRPAIQRTLLSGRTIRHSSSVGCPVFNA
jgi:hypothetical protein